MNRMTKILLVALVIQAGLVVVMWTTRSSAPQDESEPVVAGLAVKDVTGYTLVAKAADKEQTVELAKKGDAWVVSGADDFPADTQKVEEILDKVVKARRSAPIASNKANHNALDVGERDFSRRLTLKTAEATHTLIIGSAKGNSVHVRQADQDDVYLARGLSAFELKDTITQYVETKYVEVEAPDSVKVTNNKGTVTLLKVDGRWTVPELPADAPVDTAAAEALVNSARSLRLVTPIGKTVKPEYALGGGDGATVEVRKGEVVTRYQIGGLAPDTNRFAKSDQNEWVVTVAPFAIASLLDQTPDKLIKVDKPAGDPGAGDGTEMPFDPGALPFPMQ